LSDNNNNYNVSTQFDLVNFSNPDWSVEILQAPVVFRSNNIPLYIHVGL